MINCIYVFADTVVRTNVNETSRTKYTAKDKKDTRDTASSSQSKR